MSPPLAKLGKTLILRTSKLFDRLQGGQVMFSFLNSRNTNRGNAASDVSATSCLIDNNVAHQLLESADSTAGRDPQRAQELRDAARAFLSVVR